MEADFIFYNPTFLPSNTIVRSPIGSRLQPVCLSGLRQKHNGVLRWECRHMLSGLNQQAEGTR